MKEPKGADLKSAFDRLEKIVADLGKKDVYIDAGLEKFREGVGLIKYCRGILKKSENEFKKLQEELEVDGEENVDG